MNQQQPGFVILVVVAAVIGGGWLVLQLIGACISLLSVGLGCGPDFSVVAGFFLAIAIALYAVTRKDSK
jgi:hypothetical protein